MTVARQVYTIGVLLLMYIIAYLDRQVLALMVDPIKASLKITDVQFSLVHGLAFGLFYALAGLPMGYLVDRYSKRWMLFIGINVWSAATVLCGLARSFPMLAAARFGVGAGEATLVPVGFSTIARILPPERVAIGIAVFSTGTVMGIAVSMAVGGYLIALLTGLGGITLPIIGHLEPWQAVFVAVGLPGVLFSFLSFTLPETRADPAPADAATGANAGAGAGPAALLPFLRTHRRYLTLTIGGLTVSSTMAYAAATWVPALLLRQHHAPIDWVGYAIAIAMLIGVIGYLLAGQASDMLFRRGLREGHVVPVLVTTPVLAVVSVWTFHFAADAWSVVAGYSLFLILITACNPVAAHIQIATPPELRGRLAAITVAIQQMSSLTLGPLLVAMVTDHVFGDPTRVGDSLALVMVGLSFVAVLLYWLALAPARAAIAAIGHAPGPAG